MSEVLGSLGASAPSCGSPADCQPSSVARLEALARREDKAAGGVQGPSFRGSEWGADIIASHRQNAHDIRTVLAVLEEGRRAIGDHFAPNDCYATGPLTGDPIRDLVQCPACSFIAMYDAAKGPREGERSEVRASQKTPPEPPQKDNGQ